MTIGERIKKLRVERGMSQEELGRRVGLQKAAIYKYENGIVTNLKRSVIAGLAEALDTTPIYIMGWESPDSLFGEMVTKRRKEFGFTKEALASHINVSVDDINKWESGQSFPFPGPMMRLINALNLNLDEVISLNHQMARNRQEEAFLLDQVAAMGMISLFTTDDNGNRILSLIRDGEKREFTNYEYESLKASIREYIKFKMTEALNNAQRGE